MFKSLLFILTMFFMLLPLRITYADCDDEACTVDWENKEDILHNGYSVIECPGGGDASYWVTKYSVPDVGPDNCGPTPLLMFNIYLPPGDEAYIDWPGYGQHEYDPLNQVVLSAPCYKPVVKTANNYWFIYASQDCEPIPSYNSDYYYSQTSTQTCCKIPTDG